MDPFIISSIILSASFFIALIFNYKLKNNIIKYSFLGYSFIFLLLVFLSDNNFIYQFLKQVITYVWYPSYLLFVITVIINILIFIFTLLLKKVNLVSRIINYFNFIISVPCYTIFLRLGYDPSIASEYYQNNVLSLVRIVTISFLISLICNIIIRIRGMYEK